MTFDEYIELAGSHSAEEDQTLVVPVYRRLSADLLTPVSAFLALRQSARHSFLLESVEGGEKLARYSFLGRNPYRIVQARGSEVEVREMTPGRISYSRQASVYDVMQEILDGYSEVKIAGLPRFTSGVVGFLGYDTVRLIEHLPDQPQRDLEMPDAVWSFYDMVIAFDHVKHQVVFMASTFIRPKSDLRTLYSAAVEQIEALEEELRSSSPKAPQPVSLRDTEMSSNFTRSDYEQAVERARRYIYEGDIFQVVLSQRFSMQFEGDRFNLYRALRQVNPSPYLYYLDFVDFALVGSSPEVLVRVEAGRAELLPIAGTRPRGISQTEDDALEDDLLADPKERAEHLMLVDLGRNDLGRVCGYHSVTVDKFAYVERYSHVMHIVSSVSGNLAEERGAMDVVAACFPAGTVSGAPKVRAMEIIDELEPNSRGVYSGAVGYIDFSGNLDTCIAIRTMVVSGDRIYVQAGAGIVADSDPAREFDETVNKARALREAMLVASKGLL